MVEHQLHMKDARVDGRRIVFLVRCGTVPAHCWVTDWFEHTSFGIALLFVTPLAGVYAAVRLVLPIAPDWVCTATAPLIPAIVVAPESLTETIRVSGGTRT